MLRPWRSPAATGSDQPGEAQLARLTLWRAFPQDSGVPYSYRHVPQLARRVRRSETPTVVLPWSEAKNPRPVTAGGVMVVTTRRGPVTRLLDGDRHGLGGNETGSAGDPAPVPIADAGA